MKYRLFFRMLRLMDANLDRLSEALRVLEDVSRFVLGDVQTTETLKRLRHELTTTDPVLRGKLLAARDSAGDIGREGSVAAIERQDLIDLVTANARRAQESLRTLEEFAKLPEIPPGVANRAFEPARFLLYEIERDMVMKLSRVEKQERIDGLYVIIDTQALSGRSAAEVTRQTIDGGARIIQLRDKSHTGRETLKIADQLRETCSRSGTLFIINDSVEVALAIDADGVHVGQDDLPVPVVRQLLPADKIIGCSARTVEQALRAQQDGADYLGVGAVYASPTKPGAEVIGVEALQEIRKAVSIPIVAIGGINEENAGSVLKAGADSVAAVGAVLNAGDIAESTRRLAAKAAGGRHR